MFVIRSSSGCSGATASFPAACGGGGGECICWARVERTGPGKLPRREGIRGRIGFGITMRAHVSEGGRGSLQGKEKRRHQEKE